MVLRDLFVTLVVFGALPFVLTRPWFGVLIWSWLSLMNPHRLAWGFAREMPFAQMVAITLLVGYFISDEPKRIPWTRETILLLVFLIWMFISTLFSLYPDLAWMQWNKVWKIQLITFLTLTIMYTRERLHLLVWTVALSLGFFGVKGGIWVLFTGGVHHVIGPAGTFIGGNNEIGLALIMTVPLLRYLQLNTANVWVRRGLTAAMVLTPVAILGTHSRGALVGIVGMIVVFLLKTRRKFLPILIVAASIPFLPSILPQHWFDRMHTIETYEEDGSARERLRAWGNAYELASQRPLVGGGYDVLIYWGGRDAHSIYFEVLAEHGFVGLALFLLIGFFTWRSATWIIRKTKRVKELKWASDLAAMLQVSMFGYCLAGAFLGLAYFDLIYCLMAIVVLTRKIVEKKLQETVKADKLLGDVRQAGELAPSTPSSETL